MEKSTRMYPRVKVRVEKEEDEEFLVEEDEFFVQKETCFLPLFRILDSVSVQKRSLSGISSVSGSGNRSQNDSSPSVAGVPANATTSFATSKGSRVKNNNEIDEETRIRASPVPRPRAVISSPENDWMIGSRNRLAREQSPNLKKNNLSQKSPAQDKFKCIRAAGLISTRKGSDERRNEKKGSQLKVPKKKTFL
ncbi:hypothetical protein NE237_016128 [Protea cynaroides]|uniref:Uncharacterized protein n=1 Tax=Protea cynaroides TaxID=273540 RepID=A0A9Q0KF97_9MAGN|nr:hypothetical protein NE237_016128 [Protea cynaroides]